MRLHPVQKIIHQILFQSLLSEQKSRKKIYQTVSRSSSIHTLIIYPVTQSYRLLLIHWRNTSRLSVPSRHFALVRLVQCVELERDREMTRHAGESHRRTCASRRMCARFIDLSRCSALRVHACHICTAAGAGCEEVDS